MVRSYHHVYKMADVDYVKSLDRMLSMWENFFGDKDVDTNSVRQKFDSLRGLINVDLSTIHSSEEDLWKLIGSVTDGVVVKPDMEEYMNLHLFDGTNKLRPLFSKLFGWSVPSRATLDEIVKFVDHDKVLEVGGGRGLWSALMKYRGVDVICTSLSIHHSGGFMKSKDLNSTSWTEVELMDSNQAVEKYPNR